MWLARLVLTVSVTPAFIISFPAASQNQCAREGQEFCEVNPYSSSRELELKRCEWTGGILTPIYKGPCGTVQPDQPSANSACQNLTAQFNAKQRSYQARCTPGREIPIALANACNAEVAQLRREMQSIISRCPHLQEIR